MGMPDPMLGECTTTVSDGFSEFSYTYFQCCGSGSTCFSQFLGLPDRDPLVRGMDPDPALDPDPDPSIIMQK
jgi:hypothetical protein